MLFRSRLQDCVNRSLNNNLSRLKKKKRLTTYIEKLHRNKGGKTKFNHKPRYEYPQPTLAYKQERQLPKASDKKKAP